MVLVYIYTERCCVASWGLLGGPLGVLVGRLDILVMLDALGPSVSASEDALSLSLRPLACGKVTRPCAKSAKNSGLRAPRRAC
eukprot:1257927-Pyramimonas_sp.AAC.1